jgi:aerobic-type carbon monoxide dehydrogenase small subunit (CoxS/CutS family)
MHGHGRTHQFKEGSAVNAKKYICPYCETAFDSLDDIRNHVIAVHGTESLPEEPEWTLYELIHDKIGLTGAKMFCDRGACGSCTVIMEGRPILSCMTLAIECDGKAIETIEGIAAQKHPLIEEYVDHHCMQCGYCTPGFVVTAKALLDKNKTPNEEEVKEALSGNLCRCGTYPQHVKAVMKASRKL